VTIVFSCVILECYSLQCYKGEYMPAKDDKLEETEKEPELLNCTGTDPVCLSTYIRTETIFKKSKREDTTYLAGGWFKECGRKGYQEAKERFGENESDRCVEEKEGTKRVKSGKLVHCICSTNLCNGGIHTVLSTLSVVLAMTVFILMQ